MKYSDLGDIEHGMSTGNFTDKQGLQKIAFTENGLEKRNDLVSSKCNIDARGQRWMARLVQ